MRPARISSATPLVALAAALFAAAPGGAAAQTAAAPPPAAAHASRSAINLIVPQVRHRPAAQPAVRLTAADASIRIDGNLAVTTLTLTLDNQSPVPQEAQILLPVPDGASFTAMGYDGVGPEPTAALLPKADARRTYDDIVRSMRDPALLEFAGYNLIRTSAFPVPPGRSQKVTITYEQLLASDAGRIDYVLPRSESLAASGVQWSYQAFIAGGPEVSTIYSPSHSVVVARGGRGSHSVTVPAPAAGQPGPFRLSILSDAKALQEPAASLIAYPDPTLPGGQGGYFLLLVGLPPDAPAGAARTRREVTLVLDRSGSMKGAKFQQARAAAQQVLDGLEPGEFFNIVDYSDSIASFAKTPVAKSDKTVAEARDYLASLQAQGGTNIHDALLEALRPAPDAESIGMVLFLTDGLPTVGVRSEVDIRAAANGANTHRRRIFPFGVGFDVNSPLLSNLARASRGAATFVLPEEDVEQKVSQVFRRLQGPILATPALQLAAADGRPAAREVIPAELPDFFEGDQVVILGQYAGDGPMRVRLAGKAGGVDRTFAFEFNPHASARTGNGYVPRLWASRRIGVLLDEIRQAAAERPAPADNATDPRTKELVDEIVRLSIKWGVMSEYTAFLATEGRNGAPPPGVHAAVGLTAEAVARRAADRSGSGGVNQEKNIAQQAEQTMLNAQNRYWDGAMREVEVTTVQQLADQTLFRRNNRWVDANILKDEAKAPERTVEFGTPEFAEILDQLVAENRQGMLAQGGEVYLLFQGKRVLVKLPA